MDIAIREEGQVPFIAPVRYNRIVFVSVKYLDAVHPAISVNFLVFFGESQWSPPFNSPAFGGLPTGMIPDEETTLVGRHLHHLSPIIHRCRDGIHVFGEKHVEMPRRHKALRDLGARNQE